MSSQLKAAYDAGTGDAQDLYPEDGMPEALPAAPSPSPPPAATALPSKLRLNVACMSRAGREPGYKKTNQDNCFAFEKYITEDQSLFGAMDGHGPHGHLVSGYLKQHLPIILVNHLTSDVDPKAALTRGFLEVHAWASNTAAVAFAYLLSCTNRVACG